VREIKIDDGALGSGITDMGFIAIAQHCPLLESFEVEGRWTFITGVGIAAIVARCQKLRRLKLVCHQVTVSGLEAVATHCPGLREFMLIHCLRGQAISRALAGIAMRCPQLEYVTVDVQQALTDNVAKVFALCCPKLRRLSLQSDFKILDGSIDGTLLAIVQLCPGLEELEVEAPVTDAVLDALAAGCPKLSRLVTRGGPSLTAEGVHRFIANCLALRTLYLDRTRFPDDVLARLNEPLPEPSTRYVMVYW
jgi:hypothetical protein